MSGSDAPPVSAMDGYIAGGLFLNGGVGTNHVPVDSCSRGTLAVPRPRNVFQAPETERDRAYYTGMPKAS